MRKEAKSNQNKEVVTVQGYHNRAGMASNPLGYEGYAFNGFKGNYYFNSDRKIKLDSNYQRTDGQPLMGYGLEIETECSGINRDTVLAEVMDKIIFPCFKFGSVMFKMQEDGSLGGRSSVEVITQVMTKSRIRNDYAAYKTMFNTYFPAFRICADSYSTNCGMHVNVSNAIFGTTEAQQIEAIRKLYYIVNKHYDVFTRAFYRDPEKTRWCARMDYSNARNMNIYNASGDHGNCMNLSHFAAGRIEIRLVGGQRDYYGFRNTMETVFHLCEKVKSLSWEDCDDIVKIFSGCNQYVLKRLPDCGITVNDYEAIKATATTEDLELQ